MESMTKEEMQRFLIKEAQRGSTEIEAYRNLMEILGIEFPSENKKEKADEINRNESREGGFATAPLQKNYNTSYQV